MQYGWDHYAPDADTREQRYAAPRKAHHRTAPRPASDPDPDRGERRAARRRRAYARLLDQAGVDVTNVRYNGAIDDFALLNALREIPSTDAALRQAAANLATTCADERTRPARQSRPSSVTPTPGACSPGF
jgi:acetyl esterase/lipase